MNKKRSIHIKTISILGSGWLGLPLAKHLVMMGNRVNASTTSESRLSELTSRKVEPFIIDISKLSSNINTFLQANVLIINIPSKNIDGFSDLINEIHKSEIKKVLFVSSTSVYKSSDKVITEHGDLADSNLVTIENLFRSNSHFSTTIVRFAGLMGYNRHPGRFFPQGRAIPNPKGVVNMIHQDDCIAILNRIIEMEIWNDIFNACADQHPTRRAFFSKAALELDLPIPDFLENSVNKFKCISNEKLKSYLKYEFIYPDILKALERNT